MGWWNGIGMGERMMGRVGMGEMVRNGIGLKDWDWCMWNNGVDGMGRDGA